MAMSMTVTPSRYSRNAGVYRIVNTTNGRCYFGSAVNFHRRAITHVHALRNGNSHSKKLQAAWNKYGESSFKFEVVLVCARRDAVMYEQIVIDMMNAANTGYNVAPVAGSMLGVKKSKESIERTASKLRGRKLSDEHVRKISEFQRGRPHSDEHIRKVAESNRGKKRTPDQIQLFSEVQKGKRLSDETRRILREQRIGIKRPEVGKAISATKQMMAGTAKSDKLNPELVRDIKRRLHNGEKTTAIAVEFGVSQSNISLIKSGNSWSHIE